MILLVCGLIWINPASHVATRACVPMALVVGHRHLEGDRRVSERT